MAIEVLHYEDAGRPFWGRLEGGRILPLMEGGTTAEFLAAGGPQLGDIGAARSQEEVRVLSPVTDDRRILCQGKNYAAHIVEGGMRPEDKSFNMFFTKASSSLAAPGSTVQRPAGVELLDYEVELGLVIGAPVDGPRFISSAELPEVVAAITVANDVSARDIQFTQQQWFKGKSYRGFCPTGPKLVFPEKNEWSLLDELDLELWVNGELRQKGSTANMIYPPAATLSEFSVILDLKPGDLILTGTPSGVALKAPSHKKRSWLGVFFSQKEVMRRFVESQKRINRYLRDGDRVSCRVSHPSGALDTGMLEFMIGPGPS